ncbi:hypothetical protein BMG00_13175 [Thioclava marina]|uniref:Uncharacterized protein n=1 Tax=Thioclava marina TaxID=1915077 RepID=A0ABX3MKX0_9RHOB|nr:hypothetical protein BMG00_13175 [Thioclava marina]
MNPATDPTVMKNLLIAIDEKTDSLMALRELLKLLETEQSDLGKALLDALSMMTTELGANRSIHHMHMDALKEFKNEREDLVGRMNKQEVQLKQIKLKLNQILNILGLPMS